MAIIRVDGVEDVKTIPNSFSGDNCDIHTLLNVGDTGLEKFVAERKIRERWSTQTTKEFDGVQYIFRFPNGLGASVIKTTMSYGGCEDKWEVALIKWDDDDNTWELHYDSDVDPVFRDVAGHLTDGGVVELLEKIRDYKPQA